MAIKILDPNRVDPAHQARFQREAELLARLEHPHVLRVFDVGQDDQHAWLISELLDGESLETLDRGTDFLPLMRQVAEALEAVHEIGLVHRDVKPANIVLTEAGRVVLLDFGLMLDPDSTRITATGQFVGTPAFLDPEIARGAQPGPASDWFSWGASLYYLAEGKKRVTLEDLQSSFQGKELREPVFEVLDENSAVARLVRATTSGRPGQRRTGPEALAELDAGGSRSAASPPAPGGPSRRTPWVTTGILLACGLGIGAISKISSNRSQVPVVAPAAAEASAAPVTSPEAELSALLEDAEAELALVPVPPELPLDPLALRDLPGERPRLVRLMAWPVARELREVAPLLESEAARRLDERMGRLGLPHPLAPFRNPTTRPEPIPGMGRFFSDEFQDLELDLTRVMRAGLDRRRALEAGAEDLPQASWRGVAARISGFETLIQDSFLRPESRAVVSAWMRPTAESLRRFLARAAARAREAKSSDTSLSAALRSGIDFAEIGFWSEVSFLGTEVLLGPRPKTFTGWLLRADVLAHQGEVRRLAGVQVEEEALMTAVESAVSMAEALGSRVATWVARSGVEIAGDSNHASVAVRLARRYRQRLLRQRAGEGKGSWLLKRLGPTWLARLGEDAVRRDAEAFVAWIDARPGRREGIVGAARQHLGKLERALR